METRPCNVDQELSRICLDNGFDFFSTLPGSYNVGLIRQITKCEGVISVPLVREESGVALNAGAYLGGRKTGMIIQNQGLGNLEGQLLALNSHLEGAYRFPNLYIISHRGLEGEKIEAQKPMGIETRKILDEPGIKQCSVESPLDLKKVGELLEEYDEGFTVVVTVRPDFDKPPGEEKIERGINRRLKGWELESQEVPATMTRYEALSVAMQEIEEEFVVCNMGLSSRELYHIKDRIRNFYLTSSLGQTYMMGLGLALTMKGREEKIICFEGDGGLLMNSGSLALVASREPENFVLVALDNGVYGSTGNVSTYASEGLNLSALALAYGFPKSKVILAENAEKLYEALDLSLSRKGPWFIHVILKPGNRRVPVLPLENTEIKQRFIDSLKNQS